MVLPYCLLICTCAFELQNLSETFVPTKNPDKETTVFENNRKSRIQHSERSELRLHLHLQKFFKNAKNGQNWQVFENLKLAFKQCYQTGQFFIGQKLVKNAKI